MGTTVQIENCLPSHFQMKDLNRESNSDSCWPSCFGESNLSNGQFYYGFLPRTLSDSHPGYDKDFVRQTILEHEAIFKNQVYELHRLYRVQRDLMDEVRRKEQYKRRITYETSSSSSPVPSHLQYEDFQRWNDPNPQFTNSIFGKTPISVPETPNSVKGKSVQVGPSSFPNCYSPKNSESESRPSKFRRRILDLQLPAEEYVDTEVVQFNDVKDSNFAGPPLDNHRNSDSCSGKPTTLADLNEPLLVDEVSVDFLDDRGGNRCESWKREFSARFVNTSKDCLKNQMNGTSNNVHFKHRNNGVECFGSLESENKGGTRSINQGICQEKVPVASQSIHILDHISGDQCKEKSVINQEKFNGGCHSLSKQSEFSHPSDSGKPWIHSGSGKPGSFLGQKPLSAQPSPYPTSSTVSNGMFGNNKWNLNNTPSVLGNETPLINGFYEGSSSSFKGFDHVSSNFIEKKVNCSSVNFCKSTNRIDSSRMKGVNLNDPLPNGLNNDDHFDQKGAKIVNKGCKLEDSPSILPWLKGKKTYDTEVENLLKDPNSIESVLSRWGSSIASSSCEVDVKAKVPESNPKILGIPIFLNHPPTPKKEVSKPLIIHCCSGNKESESSERKHVFDINLPCEEEDIVVLEENSQTKPPSVIVHHFDLNSCVIDAEISCETTFSVREEKKSVRVGTGIDLEAPVVLENEETIVIPLDEDSSTKEPEKQPAPPQHIADDVESELARSVASAIVAMSSFIDTQKSEDESCLVLETEMDDPLHWFVEIACSNNVDDLGNGNDLSTKCLDDFEMMTLRQKICNEEEYFPISCFPDVPDSEERDTCVLTTTRTRRGNARRGRQRRDFQRDILPGLVSLSRHEVTEDLQMFGGLMRATGHPWHTGPNRRNATRNGCARGRRRSAAAVSLSPAPVAALCAIQVRKKKVESNNSEVGGDDRSLTGWGKTTRRPRRQRCPGGNSAPAPVPLT